MLLSRFAERLLKYKFAYAKMTLYKIVLLTYKKGA